MTSSVNKILDFDEFCVKFLKQNMSRVDCIYKLFITGCMLLIILCIFV